MNCVDVTCLTVVIPSSNLNSSPPYFAETIFQVPISLWSDFASPFGSAERAVAAVIASATISARRQVDCNAVVTLFMSVAFQGNSVVICFVLSFLSVIQMGRDGTGG